MPFPLTWLPPFFIKTPILYLMPSQWKLLIHEVLNRHEPYTLALCLVSLPLSIYLLFIHGRYGLEREEVISCSSFVVLFIWFCCVSKPGFICSFGGQKIISGRPRKCFAWLEWKQSKFLQMERSYLWIELGWWLNASVESKPIWLVIIWFNITFSGSSAKPTPPWSFF